MRYVVGHFLHVFTYILLTRVQLFIDKPRPFAQIEIDAGAHAQIFTIEGIPSGTEALRGQADCQSHPPTALPQYHLLTWEVFAKLAKRENFFFFTGHKIQNTRSRFQFRTQDLDFSISLDICCRAL